MNVSGELLLPALTGYISTSQKDMQRFQEFFVTSAKAANFPWQSQALWFFSQMLRWGNTRRLPFRCRGGGSRTQCV